MSLFCFFTFLRSAASSPTFHSPQIAHHPSEGWTAHAGCRSERSRNEWPEGQAAGAARHPVFRARSFGARHPCLFSLASGERVSFSCVAKRKAPLRRRSGANSEAGPQGGGQEPGVKRRPPRYSGLRAFGNCSCVALDGCSGRRSTASIHGCGPRASMPSRAQPRRSRFSHALASALRWHFLLPQNGRRCRRRMRGL